MINAEELKSGLAQHYGTMGYTRYNNMLFPDVVLTDGALYLASKAQCYWLMDIIASVRNNKKVLSEELVVVKLKVNEDKSAVVTLENGNSRILYKQEVGRTDFPLDEITLYVCRQDQYKVIMLTSEY